eukprot:CAMPEP_0194315796 /NCGR_PEP_ID=MMETSP0171-20130528/12590_1 /TAXON_ID=218684 /ORGANISM="Corethron pennatum, Strain L29A3" /LENGTH=199 /DNA_ID=CAMNT_0039071763 /DNA_START=471 /DNA_END=1067 /DNA_ORIENTATION=-
MSQIIDGLKILIVLDDVWNHEDVELFNFGEHMTSSFRMLLTSRTLDMEPCGGSEVINVELLNPDEARGLFCIESGLDLNADNAEVIDSILKICGYLPLTVRMIGKLVKNSRTIQPDMCLKQVADIIMAENSYSGMTPVYDILDRTFLFVTDEKAAFVLRLFFSAFAVVFCRKDILRPWVIFEAVALLWRGLIQTEYMQV